MSKLFRRRNVITALPESLSQTIRATNQVRKLGTFDTASGPSAKLEAQLTGSASTGSAALSQCAPLHT